jgi:DNA-binding response OmpR family regulator
MGSSTTVDVHILRLRRKLGDSSKKHGRIRTVWGSGYRFNASARGA